MQLDLVEVRWKTSRPSCCSMKRRDSLSLHPAPPSRTDDDEETKKTDRMKMMMIFMMGWILKKVKY